MPGLNWREGQGQDQVLRRFIGTGAAAEGGDWRSQLPPGSRHRIVNKLLDTLKNRHLLSGEEGLSDLAAVRFEESVFTSARSQSVYFSMISLKLLGDEVEFEPRAESPHNDAASTSRISQHPDSSSQIGSARDGDWQEETYQEIRAMDEIYRPELYELYQRMAAKQLEQDTLHSHLQPNEQLDKLRFLMNMLERLMMFLRTTKDDIKLYHKEKIVGVRKQIVNILNSSRSRSRPRRPVSPSQQGQLTQPHTHAVQHSQQRQPQTSGYTNRRQISFEMQPYEDTAE